jgi:hypothetical protein
MTADVIDLQRYRAQRRDRASPTPVPAGLFYVLMPAVYCVPVMMMPTPFTAPATVVTAS